MTKEHQPARLIRRFYAPEYLVKGKWLGCEYDTKTIYGNLLHVAWPSVLESVLIGLISFIDTVMVSSCGYEAVAAVGLTGQPKMIFYAFFFALNVGVTAIVSRRKGEGDRDSANKCMSEAVGLTAILGIVLVGTSLLVAKPLLIFAGANKDTLDMAVDYFDITMIGMYFTALGLIINAAHRGCGKTKITMVTNLAANLINILFNYLLINGIGPFPKWGVKGAAVATLIGNIIACAISFCSVMPFAHGYLLLDLKELFRFRKNVMKLLMKISGSAGIEQIFMRIGFFAYAKMVAELGTVPYATHQICMTIINLSFTFGDGLQVASASLVGQNLGAKRSDLALIYGKAAQRIGLIFGTLLLILFSTCGKGLISMFMSASAASNPPETIGEIIVTGVKILFIVAVVSPAQISQVVFAGSLRGAGDTKYVAVSSLISIALVRPVLTYIFCYPMGLGVIGAWWSLLVDQYMRLLLTGIRFGRGKWRDIKF